MRNLSAFQCRHVSVATLGDTNRLHLVHDLLQLLHTLTVVHACSARTLQLNEAPMKQHGGITICVQACKPLKQLRNCLWIHKRFSLAYYM